MDCLLHGVVREEKKKGGKGRLTLNQLPIGFLILISKLEPSPSVPFVVCHPSSQVFLGSLRYLGFFRVLFDRIAIDNFCYSLGTSIFIFVSFLVFHLTSLFSWLHPCSHNVF